MKPGPAISVASISRSSGIAAIMAVASWRGFTPACLARASAMLVAKSPCAGSRVRSIVMRLASASVSVLSATKESRAWLIRDCMCSCMILNRLLIKRHYPLFGGQIKDLHRVIKSHRDPHLLQSSSDFLTGSCSEYRLSAPPIDVDFSGVPKTP
jgi:hypothetical protein